MENDEIATPPDGFKSWYKAHGFPADEMPKLWAASFVNIWNGREGGFLIALIVYLTKCQKPNDPVRLKIIKDHFRAVRKFVGAPAEHYKIEGRLVEDVDFEQAVGVGVDHDFVILEEENISLLPEAYTLLEQAYVDPIFTPNPATKIIPQETASVEAFTEGFFSCGDLAAKHKVGAEPLRKRLDRFRRDNANGWKENSNNAVNEARFLFQERAVKDIIIKLKTASDAKR